MNNELIRKIDSLIEETENDLVNDTIRFVNIKSVKSEPKERAPFGTGVKKVLDTVSEMSEKEGFFVSDYNVGVISAALFDGHPDLGIWLHADVVPEGDGWEFEPYRATLYKGCIVGRGATDNKGQLAAIFNLFKIFKKLGVSLKYNPAIYVGSNEEFGMTDLIGLPANADAKGFLNVCTPPKLSLVPDGGFPVGYGGKGGIKIRLKSKSPLHGFILTAGEDSSPGRATAVFDKADLSDTFPSCTIAKDKKNEVSFFSPPRHGANPDPNGNMITKLCSALISSDAVSADDKQILDFLRRVSLDIFGSMFKIDVKSKNMPPLTLATKSITCPDGYPELLIDVRYPVEITYDEIIERISKISEENNFCISEINRGVDPYLLNPESELIKTLNKISNEVTGDSAPPYTLSGGTYAHRLPNALVYGMSGCQKPEGFPESRGGAHGIDELVSVSRLKRAMKIYARALLALNDINW